MVLLIATLISLVERLKSHMIHARYLFVTHFLLVLRMKKIYTYLGNSHRNRFLEFSVSFKLCRTVWASRPSVLSSHAFIFVTASKNKPTTFALTNCTDLGLASLQYWSLSLYNIYRTLQQKYAIVAFCTWNLNSGNMDIEHYLTLQFLGNRRKITKHWVHIDIVSSSGSIEKISKEEKYKL